MRGSGVMEPISASRIGRFALFLALFSAGVVAGTLLLHGRTGGGKGAVRLPNRLAAAADSAAGGTPASGSGAPIRRVSAEPQTDNESDITRTRHSAIVTAAQKAGPSVVTVAVTQIRLVQGQPRAVDPFELFFHRYLPGEVYEQATASLIWAVFK